MQTLGLSLENYMDTGKKEATIGRHVAKEVRPSDINREGRTT